MSAAPPLVEMTYTQKIAQNFEIALKSGSTYVVLLASTAATIYVALDAAQIAALVKTFPILSGWVPVLGVIAAFIIAKLKPSDAISASTKGLVEEVARLRMNDFLRKQGAPELPPSPPTPLPVPPPVMQMPPVLDEPLPEPDAQPRVERRKAAPPAAVPPVAVDIDTSQPQPIDARLLLSLVAEYLREKPVDKPVDPNYTAFVEMARNLNPDTTEAQIRKGWTELKKRQLGHFSTPAVSSQ